MYSYNCSSCHCQFIIDIMDEKSTCSFSSIVLTILNPYILVQTTLHNNIRLKKKNDRFYQKHKIYTKKKRRFFLFSKLSPVDLNCIFP